MEPLSLKLPYTSCIYVNGRPLLPPVMNEQKISEMQRYKEMAIAFEKHLEKKKREKFLTKVQTIISSIQIKRSRRRCNSRPNTSQHINKTEKTIQSPTYFNEAKNYDGDNFDSLHSSHQKDGFSSIDNKNADSKVDKLGQKHATEVSDKESEKGGFDGAVNAFSALQIDSLSTSEDSSSDTNNGVFNSPKFNNETPQSVDFISTVKIQSLSEGNVPSEKEIYFSAEESDFDQTESDSVTTVLTTNIETKSSLPSSNLVDPQRELDSESESSYSKKPKQFEENTLKGNESKSVNNILTSYPIQSGYLVNVYNALNQHWGQFEQGIGNDTDNPEAIILYGSDYCNVNESSIVDIEEGNRLASEKSESDIVDELTPSSVASTNLSKYMQTHCDTNNSDVFTPNSRPSTAGTDSTLIAMNNEAGTKVQKNLTQILANAELPSKLVPDETDLPTKDEHDIDESIDNSNSAQRNHVRRSSYTLEAPSPALLAHVLKYGESASSTCNDMSSLRCYSVVSQNEKTDECEAPEQNTPRSRRDSSLPLYDYQAIHKNKQKHLERYLKQLSAFPIYTACSDLNVNDFNSGNAEKDKQPSQVKPLCSASDSENKCFSLEDMLLEDERRFEEMRCNLLEKHQKEMEELLQKQQQEQANFMFDILALQESQGRAVKNNNSFSPESVGTLDNISSVSDIGKTQQQKNVLTKTQTHTIPNTKVFSLSQSKRTKGRESADSSPSKKGAFITSWNKQTVVTEQMLEKMKPKFDRISAAAKGYLTRRLLKTERVQYIIKTIRDTLEFALNFQSETPIESGHVTPAEVKLHERILSQVSGACYDFHDVFFQISTAEKMAIIRQDRNLKKEKAAKELKEIKKVKRSLSSATLKALERKKAKSRASGELMQYQLRTQGSRPYSPKRVKVSRESSKFPTRPKTASPRLTRIAASLNDKSPELLKNSHSARRSLYSNVESSKTHIYLKNVNKSRLSLK